MTTPNKKDDRSARAQRRAELTVDLVCDAGDWQSLSDAGHTIQQAADAVAAWPGLISGDATVSIALSSDAEVAALNGQFRSKPKPTNVLSFPAGNGAPVDFLGDIILSEETVRREAVDQVIQLDHHVQHLVIHGVLHLLGFDHETAADAERMEALEIGILNALGIANPYTGELDIAIKE